MTFPERLVNDAELVTRARRADEAAWETLTRAYAEAAFRLAYLILGDPDDADDVAQEAFIRAYRALNQFDLARPFRPWLLSIVANLARNRLRSAGRYLAALQRAARADPEAHVGAPADSAAAEAREVWQAVKRLGQTDSEIIYLRYFLDMSEADTAQTLGVAPGTVKSRTHRALERLRSVVANDFPTLREGWGRGTRP
ncbi:MAG: RNA polymerase sigma factor [Chloroflexi bacterium]|nr:RNA polymerase sigma factor [Chloroflexota bacterium]MBI5291561.1 RNA polymerase sigma factor [Chloroflexota bacterium]